MDKKVKFISSIRTKVIAAIFLMALIAGLDMMIIYNPRVEDIVTKTNSSYIEDLAISYGTMVEIQIEELGVESALTYERLAHELDGAGLDGIKSSYVYVVSPEGVMLYHPTEDKVGELVENAAVKSAVQKIANGQKVENEVIHYEFKGAMKYAGLYLNEAQDYILVVTADEDELFQPVKEARNRGIRGLVTVLLVCIVLGAVLAYIIIKPINMISALTMKISNMDFTNSEEEAKLNKRNDETGQMSRALTALREALVEVVSTIREKSDLVMTASDALNSNAVETTTTMEQVENAVNDIAQGASSQAEDTQRATENVLIMGTMVEETNAEVEKLLEYASEMQESTEQAKVILSQLNDINNKAEEYIDIIANQTNTTNESALKISEATKLITSIAEETNLLSLNASIEAARAGEQGRGFAVVAAEIQKLAEQSNESARQIEDIISQLLRDSETAVQTMYDVKEIIRAQSEHVEQTDSAFTQINDGVQLSIKGINSISNKTSQLDDARVNVVDVVQNLTAIAEENAAGSQQTSASVTEVSAIVEDISDKSTSLKDIAVELDESMCIFKL